MHALEDGDDDFNDVMLDPLGKERGDEKEETVRCHARWISPHVRG
jgi:hypothetical protein